MCCFDWNMWRKSGLTQIGSWKKEECCNSFSDNCGYSSPCMILQHHTLIAWKKLVHWIICFQMMTHFYHSSSPPKKNKSHTLVSSPVKSEKFLRIGKLSGSIVVDMGFLKFKFLFESLNFITGNKYFGLFPESDMLNSFIFDGMSARILK